MRVQQVIHLLQQVTYELKVSYSRDYVILQLSSYFIESSKASTDHEFFMCRTTNRSLASLVSLVTSQKLKLKLKLISSYLQAYIRKKRFVVTVYNGYLECTRNIHYLLCFEQFSYGINN